MPASLSIFSLTMTGGLIAISWTLFLKKSHLVPSRRTIGSAFLKEVQVKILPTPRPTTKKWTHLILPIFLICLSFNVLRLIPYTFSQTSHLSITFRLSLPLWLSLQILGIVRKWKGKIRHLVPEGTPSYLVPLMVIIELIRLCIQPLTLGFRLGANLLAGHLLIFLCSCVVWEATSTSPIGLISFLLLFTLFALEIAVACIQAAVFTILAKQYLEENAS